MKSEKDLKMLLKFKNAYEITEAKGYAYQKFVEDNPVNLDARKKLELFRAWYSSLSDLISSIFHQKKMFDRSMHQLEEVLDYFGKEVEIPNYIDSTKLNEGISLIRVLRIGRNWEGHPDKINQEDYKLLADNLDNQVLMKGFYLIHQLLSSEMKSLDKEEIRVMIATSYELKSSIREIQNMLIQVKPYLETQEEYTPELRDNLEKYIEFVPNKDNVCFVDEDINQNK